MGAIPCITLFLWVVV